MGTGEFLGQPDRMLTSILSRLHLELSAGAYTVRASISFLVHLELSAGAYTEPLSVFLFCVFSTTNNNFSTGT